METGRFITQGPARLNAPGRAWLQYQDDDVKELISYVARALAGQPEQVTVTEIAGENGSRLELRVADGDLNHLIGKQGRTAKAMRSLLAAASAKAGRKWRLKIVSGTVDEAGGESTSPPHTDDKDEPGESTS